MGALSTVATVAAVACVALTGCVFLTGPLTVKPEGQLRRIPNDKPYTVDAVYFVPTPSCARSYVFVAMRRPNQLRYSVAWDCDNLAKELANEIHKVHARRPFLGAEAPAVWATYLIGEGWGHAIVAIQTTEGLLYFDNDGAEITKCRGIKIEDIKSYRTE